MGSNGYNIPRTTYFNGFKKAKQKKMLKCDGLEIKLLSGIRSMSQVGMGHTGPSTIFRGQVLCSLHKLQLINELIIIMGKISYMYNIDNEKKPQVKLLCRLFILFICITYTYFYYIIYYLFNFICSYSICTK